MSFPHSVQGRKSVAAGVDAVSVQADIHGTLAVMGFRPACAIANYMN